MGGRGWEGCSGVKGGKWDNCNSIINKIYFFLKRSAQKGRMEVMLTLGQDLLMSTAH